MVSTLIGILILTLVFALIWYVLTTVVNIPDPFGKIVIVILALIYILMLLGQIGVYGDTYPLYYHH